MARIVFVIAWRRVDSGCENQLTEPIPYLLERQPDTLAAWLHDIPSGWQVSLSEGCSDTGYVVAGAANGGVALWRAGAVRSLGTARDAGFSDRREQTGHGDDAPTAGLPLQGEDAYVSEVGAFAGAVCSGRRTHGAYEQAREALAVAFAVNRSLERGHGEPVG